MRLSSVDVVSLVEAIVPLFGRKKRERMKKIAESLDAIIHLRADAEAISDKLDAFQNSGASMVLDSAEVKLLKRLFDAVKDSAAVVRSVID